MPETEAGFGRWVAATPHAPAVWCMPPGRLMPRRPQTTTGSIPLWSRHIHAARSPVEPTEPERQWGDRGQRKILHQFHASSPGRKARRRAGHESEEQRKGAQRCRQRRDLQRVARVRDGGGDKGGAQSNHSADDWRQGSADVLVCASPKQQRETHNGGEDDTGQTRLLGCTDDPDSGRNGKRRDQTVQPGMRMNCPRVQLISDCRAPATAVRASSTAAPPLR